MEASVDGFCVDILRSDGIIEIQTAGFSGIRRKLRELTREHRVHLVHPIAAQRWIVKRSARKGGPETRRKSPKKGALEDIFSELVSIPDLIAHPNFSLEVVLTHEEVVRRASRASRRRRGRSPREWVPVDRRLLEVVQSHHFASPEDLARLLPEGLPDPYTTAHLAQGMGVPRWLAQKAAYCLARVGAIRDVGKTGNARLYTTSVPPPGCRSAAAGRARRGRATASARTRRDATG